MKLWINFEEKDIKKRKNGWSEGDDFEGQMIFEEEQDSDNCHIDVQRFTDKIVLHFNNGTFEMTRAEIGDLFR